MDEITVNIKEMGKGREEIFNIFFADFSEADKKGIDAIMDTFKRALEVWGTEYKYLTELALVMLFKKGEHEVYKSDYVELYKGLYAFCCEVAHRTLDIKELAYYTLYTDVADAGDYTKFEGEVFNLDSLKQLPISLTQSVNEVVEKDPETSDYINNCIELFFKSEWGVDYEDIRANWKEIKAGAGKILARYKKAEKLREDIYIVAVFDKDNMKDNNRSYITIFYCSEY